jgi:tRNA threonylcarbamoyladenosine biosynthesis protein TsaB
MSRIFATATLSIYYDSADSSDVLILAFDTSSLSGSVAVLDGPHVLAERVLDPAHRSAQTLAPAIAELLAALSIKAGQIELVATTTGPGSFTGLRIGVTTAKTFAYAVQAEVLGLSTLEVIAHQCPSESTTDTSGEIHAVLDAQRRELFLNRFQRSNEIPGRDGLPALARLEPDHIVTADRWLASLQPRTAVIGRGLDRLVERLPAGIHVAARSLWEPQATMVGRLAWRDYEHGRRDDLWKLMPVYLRPSYADEKAAAKP